MLFLQPQKGLLFPKKKKLCSAVLSIRFEVDVPTGKVGGSLLFERRGCELPEGVWGMPPRKFWNLDAWKCYFQRFPDSIWALRTIKIKTILNIFYVYYNRSFPQNINHWLLEKSDMINLRMLIKKKDIQCFKFMLSFRLCPLATWCTLIGNNTES